MKSLLLLVIALLFSLFTIAQGNNCANSDPFCTGSVYNFPAGVNNGSAEGGNNYDCLGSQPNPAWYYMEIDQPGNMTIEISNSNNVDVDFILYGPYDNYAQAMGFCGNMGTNSGAGNNMVVDCSYSPVATEYADITGAQTGEVYVLLITNFSNQNTNISFTNTAGTATTDCSIVAPTCQITFFQANIGACNTGFGTYDVTGSIDFDDPPGSGSLIVEDCFGTQHVVDTYPFPGSGTVNYTIPGLPANGAACDLTAYFSADPACLNGPLNYTAPTCPCSFTNIQANISACDPSDNTFEITGLVEFINPPGSGTLTISDCNGNSQVFNAPFASPTNYTIAGIDSDGTTNCSVTATFFANPGCTINVGPYDNPTNCVCEAEIGTFNDLVTGDANSSSPWALCFGDELDISGNADFVPSQDFSIGGITYDPGVWLLVYDCPPTVFEPNDINTDPCLLGVASTADQAWTIANSTGSGATFYYVPVTMYSMVDGIYAISINAGEWCFDLGPIYPVTFLPQITAPFTQSCQAGTATVTVTGGAPAVDGSQFTASNLAPGTAAFGNTTANNGGTITITGLQDGDNWSFDITDNNGCPISVSGTFTGTEDPSFNYAANTYCQDQADPGAIVTGTPGGSFTSAPAGLSINAGTGVVDLSASAPGTYTITYTTPDAVCFDQATFDITINAVPLINTPPDVNVCLDYTLPAITGVNLTGNEAYYTGPGGTGTQMNPGAVINTVGTTTIYLYDETGTVPNCFDETSFEVTIVDAIQDMTCPGALTAVCDISEQPPYADYNAFIAAGGSVTDPSGTVDPTTFTLVSEVSDGNSCPEVITRTYEVTDDCGVVVSCQQTITINDVINPTGTAPPDISISSADPFPPADETLITDEADNCGIPTVTWMGDASDGGNCPEIITRTYRIEDACGDFIDVTHTITIGDADIPTASNPAPINVECVADVPAPNIAVVTDAADNGGPPTVTWEDDNSDGGSCPEIITRRYRVTDDCGNFIFVEQTITIQDITDPVFDPTPPNVTVECIAAVPTMTNLNWTDNCDGAGNVVGNDVSDGGSCPEIITRTWSYTDACGNNATVSQTITIQDITAPVFDAPPANITVECIAAVPAMINLNWTDNCDGAGNVVGNDVSDGGSCPEIITRTWTYTDACGNNATVNQTITVQDITAPVFDAPPADVAVECVTDVPAMTNLGWTDNCDGAGSVVGADGPLVGGTCGGTITRTWTYTDACGNTTTVTQTITVDDTTPPTASNPPDIIVPGGPAPVPDPAVVTDEADNCTVSPVVAWVSDLSDGGVCPEIITRTYSVTDDCGNQTLVEQLIYITDPFPPTASNPAPIDVECFADVPAPDPTVVTDEADNNGVPTVTWEDDTSDGASCPEVITRRYRVTDICGNFIFVEQTITILPATNPVVPADAAGTVECLVDAQVQPTPPVVTDICGNNITPTVVAPANIVCEGDMLWAFTYTDCAGNSSVWNYTYTIDVSSSPVVPANTSEAIQCVTDIYVPTPPVVNDVCGNAIVPVMTENADPVCVGDKIYTFTYTDCGGNASVWTHTFNVNDNTPPTASNPAPISVPGSMDVPAPDPAVVIDEADNCTVNPTVTWVSDVSDGNVCNLEVITRTYSVMDDCGNEIFVTQEITILAVPAPIDAGPDHLICAESSTTLVADNPWNVPISWDNGVQDGEPFSPGATNTYTVTADNLGCISTDEVTVTVEDLPIVNFSGDSLSGCAPLTTTFTNSSIGGSSFVDCLWEFSNGATVSGCDQVTYTFGGSGLYDVTLTTTTINGCVNSLTYTDYIYVEAVPNASFTASQTSLSTMYTNVSFTNHSENATDYSWNFGDGSAETSIENPMHTFPNGESGSYVVQLIATSPLGCADTTYLPIRVTEEEIFYVPNAFTPDGDNFNEYFRAVFTSGFDPYDYTMLIFNRWGEIIWESHNYDVGWDGRYGGQIVQDGTYTWKIEVKTTATDERRVYTGHVNVIR